MQAQPSYTKNLWLRIRKHKPAMASACYIALTCIMAIGAYLLAPDHTPHADRQTVEIQSQGPGYQQLFLRVPISDSFSYQGLSAYWSGRRATDRWVPIAGYSLRGDSLHIRQWVDENTSIPAAYALKSITGGAAFNPEQHLAKRTYWLGTDLFGRDVLSRLIIGSRVSISVGLVAVAISVSLGLLLGMLAGYYRGWVDALISWLINVSWSIPTLLLVFAFTLALGKGFWQVFVAVGLTMWVNVARLVRGQVMAIREMEYIQAARVLGFSHARIMWKHILPNISGPLLVIAAGNFATAIMVEAGLSFLGLGVQPPQPSWGGMIREHYPYIMTQHAVLAIIPGLAIMLLVLAFNILGNALRDAMDVREQGR